MNIDELTIGQAKELAGIFRQTHSEPTINFALGEKVIIRTHSAGVWFGELSEKCGEEVVLKNARRMWRWWAKESISLSGVANYGVKQDESRIAPAVDKVWLKAIEILPCTNEAIKSLEECPDAKQQ